MDYGNTFEESVQLVNIRMREICDNMRSITGNTEPLNLQDMASEVNNVYDAGVELGKSIQNSEFWDKYQDYGNRRDYRYAFYGDYWNVNILQPQYLIRPTNAYYMSYGNSQITTFPYADFSECTDVSRFFSECDNLEYLPEIDLSSAKVCHQCFRNSPKLKRIEKLIVSEITGSTSVIDFYTDYGLEHCIFEGTYNCNVDLHWSTKLDHESLMSLINALKDYSEEGGTTKKVTLGTTLLAKLTDEERAIATQKGWTLA